MGEVFLARTPWAEHPLAAVKRLRPDVARVPTFVERFHHEAALAVRLAHPHLVSTLDVGSVEGQLYVAAALILGKDTGYIADRLRLRSQGGPAAVAVRLLLDGLAGLAYVHGAREADGQPLGLVHRDVTPGNLLVGYDGQTRLADFGLAKSQLSEQSKLTKHGEILGTPHYLPPEIVKGDPAGPASDIYGLGGVIYRFLTGVAPFQGSTSEVLMKVLTERPRSLAELRPDLPSWFVEVIERMLAPELADRPRSASVLAEQVTRSAEADELLVPRPAVGRWLAQLFEAEHEEEIEERERLIRELHPDQLDAPAEGTVVLARAVGTGAQVSVPEALESSAPDEEQRGTELSLSASSVLGASPPVDADEEEMPTRAVEVAGDRSSGGPGEKPASGPLGSSEGADLDSDLDTDLDHSLPPVVSGVEDAPLDSQLTLDAADLPGFVDSQGAAADPLPPTRPMPRSRRERTDEHLVTPVEDGTPQQPAPELGATATGPVNRAPTVAGAPEGSDEAVSEADAPPGWRRSLLLLTGLLALAVALGIGLGKVAARLWAGGAPPQVVALDPDEAKARLDALNRRLEGLQASGRAIPPAAWRHVARAASALLAEERARAERHLDAAETLVREVAAAPE
jgi:serine/threonine-protein kinase